VIEKKYNAVMLSFNPEELLLDPSHHPLYSLLNKKSQHFVKELFEEAVPEYRYMFLTYQ
jgi:hypothetical protein